jgi:hypothetical protein
LPGKFLRRAAQPRTGAYVPTYISASARIKHRSARTELRVLLCAAGATPRRGRAPASRNDTCAYALTCMSWITTSEPDLSSANGTHTDLMLAEIRRGLVLVGLARSSIDRASALRALREAHAIQESVLNLHASTSLRSAQDARVVRGTEVLARSLESTEDVR